MPTKQSLMSGLRLVPVDRTILLVSDKPETAHFRAKTLRSKRYDVTLASTSAQGCGLLNRNAYDLVLIELDGDSQLAVEMCERIMRDDPRQKVALLFTDTRLPITNCPDLIWSLEDPEHFAARIDALTEAA